MSLTDTVKVALRVTTDALDPEIDAIIDAAKADMEGVGVPPELLYEETMDPYVRMAIILYAKANFGFDNSEATRFQSSYRQMVKDICNRPTRYARRVRRCDADEVD